MVIQAVRERTLYCALPGFDGGMWVRLAMTPSTMSSTYVKSRLSSLCCGP